MLRPLWHGTCCWIMGWVLTSSNLLAAADKLVQALQLTYMPMLYAISFCSSYRKLSQLEGACMSQLGLSLWAWHRFVRHNCKIYWVSLRWTNICRFFQIRMYSSDLFFFRELWVILIALLMFAAGTSCQIVCAFSSATEKLLWVSRQTFKCVTVHP